MGRVRGSFSPSRFVQPHDQRSPMSNEMNTARFGSGQAVNRMEDQALVEGRGVYTDDVTLERQTHMLFLRSTQAHAKIVSVDSRMAAREASMVRTTCAIKA